MQNLVIVGAGEYYKKIVGPSLLKLEEEGLVKVICAVDILAKKQVKQHDFEDIEYRQRGQNQLLSELLSDLKSKDPVVLLGHVNYLHTPDVDDLLENGFTVMLEKPYALSMNQLTRIKELNNKYPSKLVLVEYYLTMKNVPLLLMAGLIKKESFYTQKEGILNYHQTLDNYFGDLDNLVGSFSRELGEVKEVEVNLLEGDGETGRLDQRGSYLSDRTKGGGMIMDLGIHAVITLFALQKYIGNIESSFAKSNVKIAYNNNYFKMAQESFGLSTNDIAESYSEINLVTSKKIPVKVLLGKYIPENKNQRQIIIKGDKGKLIMDMSECSLVLENDKVNSKKLLTIPKKTESKYYPVIRSAYEKLENNLPFSFNLNEVCLQAQELIIKLRDRAYTSENKKVFYKSNYKPQDIFI